MATMADVARVAGVSLSTVSHVVNGTRPVLAQTAEAVHAAIEETGYVHDHIARSLAVGSTKTIGLAMSAISNPSFVEVAHVIERELADSGYSLLLAETRDHPAVELQAVENLLGRRVDGLILAPSVAPGKALKRVKSRGIPAVLIDRFVSYDVDQVAVENVAPSEAIVGHLTRLGHTRIGMIAGLEGLATSEERVEGYRRALASSQLDADPALVVRGDSDEVRTDVGVQKLLGLSDPPTALFAGNNQMTIAVMRSLRNAGMRVPEDIALVAFDDFEWADLFHPRLTTIAQPMEELGKEAVNMLVSRLRNPKLSVRKVRLEPQFIHRDSCGCVATDKA
jgi:LacI family transcriptional regulator